MASEFRWVGPDELNRVAETRWMCYGHAGKDLPRLTEHIHTGAWSGIGDYLLAERGGAAVGTATSLPLTMWARGSPIPCQGVAWVGTVKTARRRAGGQTGVASLVMREVLRHAREREYVVSALMPFRVSFYEHFGFGVVERRAEWTLPLSAIEPGEGAGWKFVEAADRSSLAEEWQRAVQNGQCDVERTARRWSNRSQVEEEGMNFVLRPERSAAARASALITHENISGRNALRLQEWSADSAEDFRSLLAFLGSMRDQFSFAVLTTPINWQVNRLLREAQIPHRPVDHPTADVRHYTRLQLRILDHRKFLESLRLPDGIKGRVTVGIAECEGTVSRFSLEIESGRAKVSPAAGEADFQCRDKDWAAMATGDVAATQAVRMGMASSTNLQAAGLLDCLAAGVAPFCREYF